MKKTLFAFMALATAFGATSCQSDEELTQPTGKPMVINAVAEGIGTKTRATMAYKYDILWGETEQIIVKGDSKSATFDLKAGAGTTNGTFAHTSGSTFTSGEQVEAYYPASLVKDGNLVWPAQQTTSTVVPMYSKNKIGGTGTENFSFASLGAMLQIVFTTPQANVTLKSITLKDDDATMSGTFNVDENGKAGITATDKAGITLDLGDGVDVSNKIQHFHIAVPAGTYSNLTITFTGTDESTCTLKGSATLTHNTVGRLVLTGTKFIPAGPLPGLFSVSATKKVRFSKGNLWADSDKALHFEADQYGYSSASPKDASHVSYFTWSSTVDAAVGDSYSGDYLFCDENHMVSVDGSDAIYYVLSNDEWTYLFEKHSYKWVTVNGVNGYVIAPDGFTGTLAESYTDDAALATDNLVFLPAAGICVLGPVDGQGNNGYYWSSTFDAGENANNLFFNSGELYVYSEKRMLGHSVRLVLNETPAAPATTGTAKRTGDIDVNWVQLWAGGPKFAEYNVGVTDSNAESYGGYYNWGMSEVQTSSNYSNYKSGTDPLTGTDDTATNLWGSNWRMPTQAELQALLSNCDVEWTTVGGVYGRKYTGKGDYSSNSVFLPAAGGCYDGDVLCQGSDGYYWSSTPYDGSYYAYYLDFDSGGQGVSDYDPRDYGYSVRAVLAE